MKLKAVTKITAPRAIAATLLLAVGAAGSSIAVAQQQSVVGIVVGGTTYTAENIPTDPIPLGVLLAKSTDKAQLVALLNLAVQAGADKTSISRALSFARNLLSSNSNNPSLLVAVTAAKQAVNASSASGSAKLTFYEGANPSATGALNSGVGNNAASGSVVQTSNNSGGLGTSTNTNATPSTVVYVG